MKLVIGRLAVIWRTLARKRNTTDPEAKIKPSCSTVERRSALYEAYKKHAAELASIEDRQNKLFLVLLGVFSAAATVLPKIDLAFYEKLYFGGLVAVIVWYGVHSCLEYRNLRIAVRDLLVRCELAMEFYEHDAFLIGEPLYTVEERKYPEKGRWLAQFAVIIIVTGLGLLFLILFPKATAPSWT